MSNHMIEKIEGVFYPIIDGVKFKCVDLRFKGNNAVTDIETYRHYWDVQFLILQEQKDYLFKKFAVENPSSFDRIADYLDYHNSNLKVISHKHNFKKN